MARGQIVYSPSYCTLSSHLLVLRLHRRCSKIQRDRLCRLTWSVLPSGCLESQQDRAEAGLSQQDRNALKCQTLLLVYDIKQYKLHY